MSEYGQLNYGDTVHVSADQNDPDCVQEIAKIVDVNPVRWDGIKESWVVCEEIKRSHQLMRYVDGLGRLRLMFIANSCDRTLLVDLI